MQIEIPQEAENLLRQRADDAGFENVEDYVLQRALFDDEELAAMQGAANDRRAVDLISEGLRSGPMTPMTAADWAALREAVRHRSGGQ